jgi:hypothetical protein
MAPVFVPHSECTFLDGDCFRRGRCIDQCRKRYDQKMTDRERIRRLEIEVHELWEIIKELRVRSMLIARSEHAL